ncbi:hypothetical protein C7J99_15655 [Brevibacillus brevis]|nr:hypothetical protein C7J99_15655 [Brevibacillus brevis]
MPTDYSFSEFTSADILVVPGCSPPNFQLILEYDPQPPFDSGSPKKAPALLVEQIRGMLQEFAKRAPDINEKGDSPGNI